METSTVVTLSVSPQQHCTYTYPVRQTAEVDNLTVI